jgi:hypothetical protein
VQGLGTSHPSDEDLSLGTPTGARRGKDNSRFPSGMTDRKARATTPLHLFVPPFPKSVRVGHPRLFDLGGARATTPLPLFVPPFPNSVRVRHPRLFDLGESKGNDSFGFVSPASPG